MLRNNGIVGSRFCPPFSPFLSFLLSVPEWHHSFLANEQVYGGMDHDGQKHSCSSMRGPRIVQIISDKARDKVGNKREDTRLCTRVLVVVTTPNAAQAQAGRPACGKPHGQRRLCEEHDSVPQVEEHNKT